LIRSSYEDGGEMPEDEGVTPHDEELLELFPNRDDWRLIEWLRVALRAASNGMTIKAPPPNSGDK
jgi:hypothetical protein